MWRTSNDIFPTRGACISVYEKFPQQTRDKIMHVILHTLGIVALTLGLLRGLSYQAVTKSTLFAIALGALLLGLS
jgi:hypothetical protein